MVVNVTVVNVTSCPTWESHIPVPGETAPDLVNFRCNEGPSQSRMIQVSGFAYHDLNIDLLINFLKHR